MCVRRIPPNIRDIVYCTGVSLMDEDVWEFIWMKFHSSNAVSEKKILLEALTCSDNVFLLNRYKHVDQSRLGLDQSSAVIWRFYRELLQNNQDVVMCPGQSVSGAVQSGAADRWCSASYCRKHQRVNPFSEQSEP